MPVAGHGSRGDCIGPLGLKPPPGSPAYQVYRDLDSDPPALVCGVGRTTLKYHLHVVDDLHAMLVERGDWMEFGAADERKPGRPAWWRPGSGREQPCGGASQGYRGRFGMYLPPLLERLKLFEL